MLHVPNETYSRSAPVSARAHAHLTARNVSAAECADTSAPADAPYRLIYEYIIVSVNPEPQAVRRMNDGALVWCLWVSQHGHKHTYVLNAFPMCPSQLAWRPSFLFT